MRRSFYLFLRDPERFTTVQILTNSTIIKNFLFIRYGFFSVLVVDRIVSRDVIFFSGDCDKEYLFKL